jgi:hypothetical protein
MKTFGVVVVETHSFSTGLDDVGDGFIYRRLYFRKRNPAHT